MEAAGQAEHSNLLSSMPLLAHMDEAGRARIARMLESVSFPQGGSVIIREGDLGETLFFVAEGEALAEMKGEVVMRYESGDYFGELSLLTGAPRKATVKAGPNGARCLVLTRDVFDKLDFNEEMWQERQRMYDAASAERIQHFFATSSSEEDGSEDDCRGNDQTDAPPEGVPPTSELQMLRDEVTQLRVANAELQQQLSDARVEIEREEARTQQEARQTLLSSMEVVRDAQGALEDSSRAYTTSLQLQVEASAKELTVLTTANAKLSEVVKGFAGRSHTLPPNGTIGHVQQQAVVQECEAIINKLRTRLATERQEYDCRVATLRQELAKRDLQVQDLEAALGDAHHQHAKRERLLRGAVGARTTTQNRLNRLNHDLASSGHTPQVSSEGSLHHHEDAIDESQTLTTANIATFGLDDTLSSTAELMELVELVSKEF